MIIYVKIWRIGAIVIDCQKSFRLMPLYRIDRFKEEWIISLPFTECIWTPERVLKRDKKGYDTDTKNSPRDSISLSRSPKYLTSNRPGIPPSICDLPDGNCHQRGDILNTTSGTDGPRPVDSFKDCGRPVDRPPKWRSVWPNHPQNISTGTAPKGTVPDT